MLQPGREVFEVLAGAARADVHVEN
jgi:hypothetical protein